MTLSTDESIIDAMPKEILMGLPLGDSAAIQTLLLRYFNKMGRKQYNAYNSMSPQAAEVLNGCDALMDRYFADNNCLTPDDIFKYLAPVAAILEGIAAQCDSFNRQERRGSANSMEAFGMAVHKALQLSLGAEAYSDMSNDPEYWYEVLTISRERLMMSRMMSSLIPDYLYYNFVQPDVEKSSAIFEKKLKHSTRLYETLVFAFGEAIHKSNIVMCNKKGTEQERVSELLENCLKKTWDNSGSTLYISQCNSSYIKATILYVFEFMKRNHYLIPSSLQLLPPRFKRLLHRSSTAKVVTHPDFFKMVEEYEQLFENQIISVLMAFSTKDISKGELRKLDGDHRILDSFKSVASLWDLNTSGLQVSAFSKPYAINRVTVMNHDT